MNWEIKGNLRQCHSQYTLHLQYCCIQYMHTCNRNRNTDASQLDLIHLLIGKGYFFGLHGTWYLCTWFSSKVYLYLYLVHKQSIPVYLVHKQSVPVALIGSWQVIC